MMRIQAGILIFILFWVGAKAQHAGTYTYDFLNVTNSARIAALGGNQVGMADNDISFVYNNPAVLSKEVSNQLAVNYVPYVSDISVFYAGYARHLDGIGTFGIGVHTMGYGTFDRTDELGNKLGTFSASEYAILLSYAKVLSAKFRIGASVKPVISNFEQYRSFGLLADIGLLYLSTDKLFSAGLVLKNAGSQITTYNGTYERVPTDLQVGIAKKLAHAPFRLVLTVQNLLDWNMKYTVYDGNGDEVEGEGNKANAFDQLMQQLIWGVEFVPAKNFFIDLGYSYQRRKELGFKDRMSTVGFSWGVGFRVYKFRFAYSSARYHLAGTSNHFSLTTNLSDF